MITILALLPEPPYAAAWQLPDWPAVAAFIQSDTFRDATQTAKDITIRWTVPEIDEVIKLAVAMEADVHERETGIPPAAWN